MSTSSQGSRKPVLAVMAVVILAMFATSFIYRMRHPSLSATLREVPAEKSSENRDMLRVQELMVQIQSKPDDVQALIELGEAFMAMNAVDRALVFFDKAARLDPGNLRLLRDKGMLSFERKEYGPASESFAAILAKDAKNGTAHFNLGVIKRYYLNQTVEAKEHFKAVLDSEPEGRVADLARKELEKP